MVSVVILTLFQNSVKLNYEKGNSFQIDNKHTHSHTAVHLLPHSNSCVISIFPAQKVGVHNSNVKPYIIILYFDNNIHKQVHIT